MRDSLHVLYNSLIPRLLLDFASVSTCADPSPLRICQEWTPKQPPVSQQCHTLCDVRYSIPNFESASAITLRFPRPGLLPPGLLPTAVPLPTAPVVPGPMGRGARPRAVTSSGRMNPAANPAAVLPSAAAAAVAMLPPRDPAEVKQESGLGGWGIIRISSKSEIWTFEKHGKKHLLFWVVHQSFLFVPQELKGYITRTGPYVGV